MCKDLLLDHMTHGDFRYQLRCFGMKELDQYIDNEFRFVLMWCYGVWTIKPTTNRLHRWVLRYVDEDTVLGFLVHLLFPICSKEWRVQVNELVAALKALERKEQFEVLIDKAALAKEELTKAIVIRIKLERKNNGEL